MLKCFTVLVVDADKCAAGPRPVVEAIQAQGTTTLREPGQFCAVSLSAEGKMQPGLLLSSASKTQTGS